MVIECGELQKAQKIIAWLTSSLVASIFVMYRRYFKSFYIVYGIPESSEKMASEVGPLNVCTGDLIQGDVV